MPEKKSVSAGVLTAAGGGLLVAFSVLLGMFILALFIGFVAFNSY